MRRRLPGLILLVLAILASSARVHPQSAVQKVGQSHTAKRSPAKVQLRDLSGVWDTQHPGGLQAASYTFLGEIPRLTPWGQQQFQDTRPSLGPRAVPDSTDPVTPTKLGAPGCFPPGVPRIYLQVFPMEILQVPGRVIMRFEFDHNLREIWTDGRGHPSDLNPAYMGHSIGKWEGNTLIVDTIGFNDKTWLDREGHRHSEDLHLVERIRRTSHTMLQDDITMEDPKTFTKPWNTRITFELRPDWEILEHSCADYVNFDENLKMQGQTK